MPFRHRTSFKARPQRQDKDGKGSAGANTNRKASQPSKPEPSKMGTLGALLQEAGVTKAKK